MQTLLQNGQNTVYEYGDVILKVAHVSVRKGETQILRDLSLEIKDVIRPGVTQGQVVALLGPSGTGKTTLFRALAGLEMPDTGTITVEGKPVQRGTVGVVAQNYPLLAHRTVFGNLLTAAKQAGLGGSAARDQARKYLERFGLGDQENKYPSQLSGGQRQRVAIVQQFLCSDHFLLMDEPFSGLDLLAVERVIEFIREMSLIDELKTLIIVTHDITAALQVSDTVLLLGRDRKQDGTIVPGARVQAEYNLVERGLAWCGDVSTFPAFIALRQEIRERFASL